MAEQIKIAELQVNATQLINELKVTKTEIDRLKVAQKELTDQGKTTTSEFIKNETALKTSQNTYRAQQKTLEQVTGATRELDNEMKKEVKTLGEAAANNKALRQARENLNLSTEEGIQALTLINKKIDDNTDFMKENQDAHIQNKMNVGNYKDSILEALGVSQAYTTGTEALTFAQGIMAVAVGKSTGAMKVFRIALASTGVGLLVIALASLISYFTQTQEGIDKVSRVLEPLKSIFSATIGVLGKLGKSLVDVFSNPMESIKAFGTAIETNIMNRLKAFGVIWKAFKDGDIKGLLNGVVQAGTGVENLGAKVKGMGNDVNKFFGDAVKNGKEIDRLNKSLNSTAGEYNKQMEKLNRVFEEQKKIGEDVNKTSEQRAKAFKAAEAAQEAIRAKTVARLQEEMKLEQLQAERNGDISRDEINAIKEKEAAIEKAYAEEAGQTTELQNSKNSVNQEAAAKAKEIRDKRVQDEVAALEQELAHFDEKHRLMGKTLEDELNIIKDRAKEEEELLKFKLDKKLITEQEYQTALLAMKNDQTAKEEEIHQQELDRIKRFDEEKKALEEELHLLKLESDIEKDLYALEQRKLKEEQELENLKLKEEEKQALMLMLDEKYAAERLSLEDKHEAERLKQVKANALEEIDAREKLANAKMSIAQNISGLMSAIASKDAGVQKAMLLFEKGVAAAQVIIQTQIANAKAVAMSPLTGGMPWVGYNTVNMAISLATIGAQAITGIQNINKQSNQSEGGSRRMARGGVLSGASHAQGGIQTPYGELEGGEAVINKRSTAMYAPLLSAINEAGGGVRFADGGVLGSAGANRGMNVIDYDLLGAKVAQANMSLPAPQVAVSEIKDTQTRVQSIEQRARF